MCSGHTLEVGQEVGGKGRQMSWDRTRGQRTHGNQMYDTYGLGKPGITLELFR